MQIYETGTLTLNQKNQFIKWFDKEIGTESEVNEEDFNKFYIMFYDLTPNEVKKIRNYENEVIDKEKTPSVDTNDYSYFATFGTDAKITEYTNIENPYNTLVLLKGESENQAREQLLKSPIGTNFCTTYPISYLKEFTEQTYLKFEDIKYDYQKLNMSTSESLDENGLHQIVSTPIVDRVESFWNYEYRHDLRDIVPSEAQVIIKEKWEKAGLGLADISEEHQKIIDEVYSYGIFNPIAGLDKDNFLVISKIPAEYRNRLIKSASNYAEENNDVDLLKLLGKKIDEALEVGNAEIKIINMQKEDLIKDIAKTTDFIDKLCTVPNISNEDNKKFNILKDGKKGTLTIRENGLKKRAYIDFEDNSDYLVVYPKDDTDEYIKQDLKDYHNCQDIDTNKRKQKA